MKKCIKCHIPKHVDSFSKDSSRFDKKQNTCKSCDKLYRELIAERLTKYRIVNALKNDNYQKNYRQTNTGKDNLKKGKIKSNIKFPNADICRRRTTHLIVLGELIRPANCDDCDISCKPQGHHSDYNFPRDIQWLCQSCHKDWHNNNIPLNRASGIFTEKS